MFAGFLLAFVCAALELSLELLKAVDRIVVNLVECHVLQLVAVDVRYRHDCPLSLV